MSVERETPQERMRRECATAMREHTLRRVMGEEGFRPLRRPVVPVVLVPRLAPGEALVNGRVMYSARWL